MAAINSEIVAQNLLVGWHQSVATEKIKKAIVHTKKKILIIDDQFDDYETAYRTIFGQQETDSGTEDNFISFFDATYTLAICKSQLDQNIFDDISARIKSLMDKCCMVLSDLYLFENHGMEFFSSPANATSISGFLVVKEILKVNPMMPVMMFTSSNKVWNYRLFDSYGIDEWVVKYGDLAAPIEIAKSFYIEFEKSILNLIQDKPYAFISELYFNLKKRKAQVVPCWYSKEYNEINEIYYIFFESCVGTKRMLSKQANFEDLARRNKKNTPYDSYTCSAIISQLANIVEIIYHLFDPDSKYKVKNIEGKLVNRNADDIKDGLCLCLFKMRNLAAHSKHYKDFDIDHVLLSLQISYLIISYNVTEAIEIKFPRFDPWNYSRQDFSLVWLMIQFSHTQKQLPENIREILHPILEKMLREIFYSKLSDSNFKKFNKDFTITGVNSFFTTITIKTSKTVIFSFDINKTEFKFNLLGPL